MKTNNQQSLNRWIKPGSFQPWAGNLSVTVRTFVFAVAVAAILIAAGSANADWRVIDYPGAVGTHPKDVSGNTVVGHYYNDDGGAQGFVYDGETWTDLNCPGAWYTFPNSISGNKIVGSYFEDDEVYHGFVYDGTTWTTLDYPGADETYVNGIDGDNIVGNYLYNGTNFGFVYDGTTWTSLFNPESSHTFVNSISDGIMVGNYQDFEYEFHGHVYDGLNFTTLDFQEALQTWVWGISGDKVVGYYSSGPPGAHGYLYDVANTTWTTLDFPGAISTHPWGVDGQSIVGEFKMNDGMNDEWHGFIYSIAPDPSSHSARAEGWVVGSSPANGYGVILHTTNGGHEWVRQGSLEEVPNVALNSVKAVDRHTAWVVGANDSGYGVILRTDDGGQTWARQGDSSTIPDVELTGIDAANRKTAWVIGDQGTILRTDDGGKTWMQQTSGVKSTLLKVAVVNSRIAWIAGYADSGYAVVLRTTNGGRTWERKGTVEMLGDLNGIMITAINAQTAWVVGQGLFTAKTTDGGESWEIQMDEGVWDNNDVCGVTPNTAWIATDYNNVFRTTDGGTAWDRVSPTYFLPSYYLLGVSAWGRDTAWVIGGLSDTTELGGVILHTTDGGATWRVQSTPVNVDFDRGVSFVGSRK